jgi:hypothetical protein
LTWFFRVARFLRVNPINEARKKNVGFAHETGRTQFTRNLFPDACAQRRGDYILHAVRLFPAATLA